MLANVLHSGLRLGGIPLRRNVAPAANHAPRRMASLVRQNRPIPALTNALRAGKGVDSIEKKVTGAKRWYWTTKAAKAPKSMVGGGVESVEKGPPVKPTLEGTKRLMSLLKTEMRAIGIAMAALAFSSSATLAIPTFLGKMIDMLTDPALTATDFSALTAGMMGVIVVASAASFVRILMMGVAGQRIVMNVRRQLFEALAVRSVAFYDTHTSGELVNRLSADSEIMSKGLIDNFAMGTRRIAEGIGGVAIILYLSPKLTLIMLAVIPPVFLGAWFYGKKMRLLSAKVTDALASATAFAEERLSSIRTVRSFSQEHREISGYSKRVEAVFEIARTSAIMNASFVSTVFLGVNMALLAVLYAGANVVMSGEMTAGEMTSFLLYSAFTGAAFNGIGNFYSEFVRSLGSSQRVFGLIDGVKDDESAVKLLSNEASVRGIVPETLEGSIKFDNVNFHYPTRPEATILSGLNLELEKGKTVAVVGHSGSGKSTLAALFAKLYDPCGGAIYLDGTNIAEIDSAWLRSNIGIVPQDVHLFAGSISENIAYGSPDASVEAIEHAAREANAHEFISSFPGGYGTQVGERGTALSGGQKQRIAIARALLKNPKILILDEATSALDVESEFLIQQALQRLLVGRTVLIIAHRLSTIKSASTIAVLDKGSLVETGSFQQLTSKEGGIFRKLVERQEL